MSIAWARKLWQYVRLCSSRILAEICLGMLHRYQKFSKAGSDQSLLYMTCSFRLLNYTDIAYIGSRSDHWASYRMSVMFYEPIFWSADGMDQHVRWTYTLSELAQTEIQIGCHCNRHC